MLRRVAAAAARACGRVAHGAPPAAAATAPPCARGVSSAANAAATGGASSPGLYEVRKYSVRPGLVPAYSSACAATYPLRNELLPGFLGMFVTETGGDPNEFVHFYHYSGLEERDAARARNGQHAEWKSFLGDTLHMLDAQRSSVFVESAACKTAAGAGAASSFAPIGGDSPGAVYEMRTYQLRLGYDTVPEFYEYMQAGLPSKVAADSFFCGELVFMGHTDVGSLNEVVELWRFPSMAASLRAREAARGAREWRDAVGRVAGLAQSFTTQLMRPVQGCSNWN